MEWRNCQFLAFLKSPASPGYYTTHAKNNLTLMGHVAVHGGTALAVAGTIRWMQRITENNLLNRDRNAPFKELFLPPLARFQIHIYRPTVGFARALQRCAPPTAVFHSSLTRLVIGLNSHFFHQSPLRNHRKIRLL